MSGMEHAPSELLEGSPESRRESELIAIGGEDDADGGDHDDESIQSDDEVEEPLPMLRVNSFTVKGLGLVHNYVPVVEEDAGKRCVVDGLPKNGTMRFMGLHTQHDTKLFGNSGDSRCVVQIENPDGEDKLLTEKGLLVRLIKVKLAPNETIVSGHIVKQGGKIKTWKKRFASLDGDGCLRYYTDLKKKTLKGIVDVRRDCIDILSTNTEEDCDWPLTAKPDARIVLVTEQRTYNFICNNEADAATWKNAFKRVSRSIARREGQDLEILEEVDEKSESVREAAATPDVMASDPTPEPLEPTPEPFAEDDEVAPRRARRHQFRNAVTNNKQMCANCKKHIGYRVKHRICTQCRKRFHLSCPPLTNADCCPPAFGTPQAVKRTRPVAGSNLAAAVMHLSRSGKVPGIVEDLIEILELRGMIEGVYRVPGNKHEMQRVLTHYFSDPTRKRLGVYAVESVHDCSSALKLFLRNLDEPLVTFELYFDFIQTVTVQDAETREEMMIHVLGRMPLNNFYTLKTVVFHLHKVAENVDKTKMKVSNLAAVFAPTLMQSPGREDESLQHVMAQMKTVDVLLKLKTETWEAAEMLVQASGRINSASPVPQREKKGARGNASAGSDERPISSRTSSDAPSEPRNSDNLDLHPGICPPTDEDNNQASSKLSSRASSTRANPIISSDVQIGSNQEEIEDLLEECQPADTFTIGDASDVVEGLGDGAMLPGFEEFSLDSFGDGTVTLDTRENRRKKAGDRLSGKMLGVPEEAEVAGS